MMMVLIFVTAVRLFFNQTSYTASENDREVTGCLLLEGRIARNVNYSFSSFDGTATGMANEIT